MSLSLIRRGLDLLSDDIKDVTEDRRKKTKNKLTAEASQGKTLMDQISSNKQGVTKQIRRLRGQRGLARPQASVKDKRIKSAVEEFRKRQKKSCLKQNLQYFLGTKCKADQKDTSKIQFQNCGRQSRNKPDHHVKKPMEPKSLFTEEEFEQFQKEYFGRTVESGGH
ncbi:active regulator of SIRT1 [Scleropages formosus]|uniref:Active regulator of SIRT1 n=1 Tax=Scleropages formosus TaxID=113540 RepID=A0A8C9TFM4_SCLFO|nr:active regulator of SIRT1 [Scleropages formosus]